MQNAAKILFYLKGQLKGEEKHHAEIVMKSLIDQGQIVVRNSEYYFHEEQQNASKRKRNAEHPSEPPKTNPTPTNQITTEPAVRVIPSQNKPQLPSNYNQSTPPPPRPAPIEIDLTNDDVTFIEEVPKTKSNTLSRYLILK